MKRLLLPLLAALALPTAVNAEEYIELKPINPHSYLKASLVKWEENNKRYISFKGTTNTSDCYGYRGGGVPWNISCNRNPALSYKNLKYTTTVKRGNWEEVLFDYDID